MKRFIISVIVIVLSFGNCYSQNYLGKSKVQVKAGITKQISPKSFADEVGTSPINGYDKYWWGGGKTDYYTYFNSNGICFLEQMIIIDDKFATQTAEYYGNNSEYSCYVNETPKITDSHKFVQGKTTLEVIVRKNPMTGRTEYYYWFFKPEFRQDVIKFFEQYYR